MSTNIYVFLCQKLKITFIYKQCSIEKLLQTIEIFAIAEISIQDFNKSF